MAAPVEPLRPLGEILDQRQKMLLVGSLMLTLFLGALDQTIVSTAVPRILADLGGFGLLSWLFTSYMLASTVVMPLVGKLSDIFGRKLLLIGGIVVFLAGSALCGTAQSMVALIIFRAIQGVGGGAIFSLVFATNADLFPPAQRGKYIGFFTGVFSLASLLGPTIGGLLTDHAGWRWVFYVNIPVGLVAIPAIWFNLPLRGGQGHPKIDFAGAALLAASTILFLLALVWAGDQYSWGSVQVIGSLAAAAVLLALFIAQESRHPEPIIPLSLFRNRTFVQSGAVVFTFGVCVFGALSYLPTFVQTALGASATISGVIGTPQAIGTLVTSIIGGQIIARYGKFRWQTILGALSILVALLWLSTLSVDTPRWEISARMVVLGLGFGVVLPTMSLVAQNAVSHAMIGIASSTNQFLRQIGMVLGTAVFGAILANAYHSGFDDQLPAGTKSTLEQAEAAGTLPPGTLDEFDDPTLALSPPKYHKVQAAISALPGGPALFGEAQSAQREAVAIAVRRIFLVASGVAVLTLVLAFTMKEVPMRRDFRPPVPAGAPGGAPVGPAPGMAPPAAEAASAPGTTPGSG
ncbi:MAG: MFS transporter [Chloroflexi bacterium]|nr:MFS transporter [Chloroflexota bacterium]